MAAQPRSVFESYQCPDCDGAVRYQAAAWQCADCGTVLRHAAD